jgi:hypothetical protein
VPVLAAVVDLDRAVHLSLAQEAKVRGFDADKAHEGDVGMASFPAKEDPTKGKGIHHIASPPLISGEREEAVFQAGRTLQQELDRDASASPQDKLAAQLVLVFAGWSSESSHAQDVGIHESPTSSDASGYLDDLILRHMTLQGSRHVSSVWQTHWMHS